MGFILMQHYAQSYTTILHFLKGEPHGLPNPHFFLANLFRLIHTKNNKKNRMKKY